MNTSVAVRECCAKFCAERAKNTAKSLIPLRIALRRFTKRGFARNCAELLIPQGFDHARFLLREIAPLRGEAALGASSACRLYPLGFWGREKIQDVLARRSQTFRCDSSRTLFRNQGRIYA